MRLIYAALFVLCIMVELLFLMQQAKPDNVTTYAKGYQVVLTGKQWRV